MNETNIDQNKGPRRQSLVVFCAILVAIPCFFILWFCVSKLVSFCLSGEESGVKPLLILSLMIPSLLILIVEYYCVERKSQKAALIASSIHLVVSCMYLFIFVIGLFCLEETKKDGNASNDTVVIISLFYFALTAFISFGHLRWYLFLRKSMPIVTREKGTLEYIGFGERFLSAMIDFLIFIPIANAINTPVAKYSLSNRTIMPQLLLSLAEMAIIVFLVVRFGGTPGKWLLRIRIVNKRGKFLNVVPAVLRSALVFPSYIVYLLKMNKIIDTMPVSESVQTLKELGQAMKHYGGIYGNQFIAVVLVLLIPLIDIIFIFLTKQKRAAHDFIAGSYVISKQSYLENKENDESSVS